MRTRFIFRTTLLFSAILLALTALFVVLFPLAPDTRFKAADAQVVEDKSPTGSLPMAGDRDLPEPIVAGATDLLVAEPIDRALERALKKGYGLFITPETSPVAHDRFHGYHTGVDFETGPDEQEIDVPVYAICDGPLILKKMAKGYGGVAVQSCRLEDEDVTVVYGHLRLESVILEEGTELFTGAQIGVLGTGFSPETDGVRKHLHLSVHKGAELDIRGYVQDPLELENWIDVKKHLTF